MLTALNSLSPIVAFPAALTAAQLSFEPPPPPSTEGLSPEKAAEAARQHADEVAAAEAALRRRVAAAMLLQKRLPKLLQRKRKIDGIRANVQRWALADLPM